MADADQADQFDRPFGVLLSQLQDVTRRLSTHARVGCCCSLRAVPEKRALLCAATLSLLERNVR